MTIKKIHFSVNIEKAEAREARQSLASLVTRLGLVETPGYEAEAIIALGGDGTIMRAVHKYPGVPVLGLNLGGLGYLARVEKKDFESALVALAEGRFQVAERAMLAVMKVGKLGPLVTALNDVVLTREMSGHAAVIDLSVNGREVTRYMCDGLVVSTPTGSTAYSLAAGGPVVMPGSGVTIVTPLNPHTLGVRPVVMSDQVKLGFTNRERSNGRTEVIKVYADGEQAYTVDAGEMVEVTRAAQCARLIEPEGYDPYDTLARKLGWRGMSGVSGDREVPPDGSTTLTPAI